MTTLKPVSHAAALQEISTVLDGVDADSFEQACKLISDAHSLVLYGCGREGLQMRGLAMRLYHLGLRASMVADMATPPLGKGDLFVVSAGPGELSTVTALIQVAKRDGAKVLFFTAVPDAPVAAQADLVLTIPAQTMASDQQAGGKSVLPMGSIYEGAMFMLFEMLILQVQTIKNIPSSEMRARHTNME